VPATFRAPGVDFGEAWAVWLRRCQNAAEIRERMNATGCTFDDAETAILVARKLSGESNFQFLTMEDFD